MENKPLGHKDDLIINGHKFQTEIRVITGRQILHLAKLEPAEDYEILIKLSGKEYEPVELNETKDLDKPGVEHFEIKPIRQLKIEVDDENYPIAKCFLTPVEILEIVGKNKEHYYLKQILEHEEITYKNDELHVIAIICHMRFSTCKKGATGVS